MSAHRGRGRTGTARPRDKHEYGGIVPVRIAQGQLTATAGLVWNGDLPRELQQLLFDTADGCGP